MPTPYFAFGSNLWQHQMRIRCPASPYTGVARLRGWKWFINARGYANVSQSQAQSASESNTDDGDDEVWGLVYDLSVEDEKRLDVNEGVPFAYEKRMVLVEFWPVASKGVDGEGNGKGIEVGEDGTVMVNGVATRGRMVEMLVYVDFKRCVGGHLPKKEYVVRMNRGIEDAVREGVPRGYVERVLRRYIPAEEEGGEEDGAVKGLALRQAAGFRDEVEGAGVAGSGAL